MSYAFSIAMHCVCLQAGRPKCARAQDPKHRITYVRPNLKTTDDFGFVFGGMMYEMSKVKESAESASRLYHQGAKPLNTKSVIMPLTLLVP
jgi:hypothetical protein